MIRGTLILLAILGASARGLSAAPPSADYELLFEDNFDGERLDTEAWSYRTGPRMDGLNRKENVSVSGGALRVAVRIDTINGKPTPTGGGVISRKPFGYGYYESRSKPFMAGTGVHSSFWQAGGGANGNNRIFEIDSYEIDSGSSLGCNNLYVHICPKELREIPWPLRAHVTWRFADDGWFLDGYEYTPDGVIFYDNGKQVARVEWPDLTAQQVVWLTGLNGCGKVDASKLPGETVFDYFRYYAREYPGVTLLPNGSFEYNHDKIDPAKPVAWTVTGSVSSVLVTKGDAAHDDHFLRIGSKLVAFENAVTQKLEHLRNGDYTLTARVRAGKGLRLARVSVSGGGKRAAEIAAAANWSTIRIPSVSVTDNTAEITVEARGAGGQWLEIDDIRFMKPPLPGRQPRTPRALVRAGEPVWNALQHAMHFPGDKSFGFFDRNVGLGDSMTVSFVMKPSGRADASPIARMPKKGDDGWMVVLTSGGDVIFRVGSEETHTDVLAKADYESGKETRVSCVFDRGTCRIFINGDLVATKTGIPHSTKDTTEPGRFGSVNDAYLAVGEVIVANEKAGQPPKAGKKLAKYVGWLRDVRVYNRALDAAEIKALGQPEGD
jgi:beta-glucanase (GH16 family)